MNNKQDLFSAISQVDYVHSELEEVAEALRILDDFMESEGAMTEETFEVWRAIQFAKRFPLYLSTFRVICRDHVRAIGELHIEAVEFPDTVVVAAAAQDKDGSLMFYVNTQCSKEKQEEAVQDLLERIGAGELAEDKRV